jgi:hypothetical protein
MYYSKKGPAVAGPHISAFFLKMGAGGTPSIYFMMGILQTATGFDVLAVAYLEVLTVLPATDCAKGGNC